MRTTRQRPRRFAASRRGTLGTRVAILTLGVLLAGSTAGCSTGGERLPGGDPFEPWDAEAQVIILDIENRNTRQARIYARWNGLRTRVGEVRGMDESRLEVEYRDGTFRIEVDFTAGDGFVSPPYSVRPGEVIRFRIPS